MITIEEIEYDDWKITNDTPNNTRLVQSIESYYLNKWYDEMKDITFETYFYNENELPDVLPFDKCMVRYIHKSPKDSEFWGAVKTKTELLNLFHTSLRCKTNKGDIYCVRKWIELGDEYRCFWNNGLVAISSEMQTEPPINVILEYIQSISHKIKFHKCVF